MPMRTQQNLPSRELFRYVKVRQPRIIDLERRVARANGGPHVADADPERLDEWARHFANSESMVRRVSDLELDYFSALAIDEPPESHLPSGKAIADIERFRASRPTEDPRYRGDLDRCALSLLAARRLQDQEVARLLSRLIAFLEIYPRLDAVTEPRRYPRVVLKRTRFRTPSVAKRSLKDTVPDSQDDETGAELRTLAGHISELWDAQNSRAAAARRRLHERVRDVSSARAQSSTTRSAEPSSAKQVAVRELRNERRRRRKARSQAYQRKTAELTELRRACQHVTETDSLRAVLEVDPAELAAHLPDRGASDVASIQSEARALIAKHGVKAARLHDAYDRVTTRADGLTKAASVKNAPVCFEEFPDLSFGSLVRVLGTGELIRVDEEVIGYSPGEISYIENILAGEVRKREVKSEKYFETVVERVSEELTELSTEAASRSLHQLTTEVANEINTRFESDLSAAVNASGGGTIGVMDVEGGASVNAGVGIGIDTSMSSETSSELSQEILKSAIERTKKSAMERRLNRSYSLYHTLDHHEINNTVGDVRHRNGIYRFLDKRVLIRETVYGVRVFLLANVPLPGKNLLCAQQARIGLNKLDLGDKPLFDISPDDVQPATYKTLIGIFNAANVQPPPAPTTMLARVYKLDATNANVEQPEFDPTKIASILVPYFKNYKRFLITENIKLPDGYQVRDVWVTVNHGSNGVSIPAHLPFTLAGATALVGPSVMAGGAYAGLLLPVSLWYVAYIASPLLHYNADSSNVTVSVGTESMDSPYYFFPPDFLIQEIFGFFSDFSAVGPGLIQQIQQAAVVLVNQLTANAAAIPQEIAAIVNAKISDLIDKLRGLLNSIVNAIDLNPLDSEVSDILTNISALSASAIDLTSLQGTMGELFAPVQTFIDTAFALIDEAMQDALSDLFAFLGTMFENSQLLPFTHAKGTTGELPISLNAISLKPGVTINVTARLERTERALDAWRLETFSSLYQGYLQQAAEYESRSYSSQVPRHGRSPSSLRLEEHDALKELVLHALNNYTEPLGNRYTLEKMNLFENAIDWKNMAYRVFTYGPNLQHILFEKAGVFAGADDRRKAFLTALWAQVMIPLQPHEHLEKQIGQYLTEGIFDFEGDLGDEELTALYRDLVLQRALVEEEPTTTTREETIPTDLVVIATEALATELSLTPASPSPDYT